MRSSLSTQGNFQTLLCCCLMHTLMCCCPDADPVVLLPDAG